MEFGGREALATFNFLFAVYLIVRGDYVQAQIAILWVALLLTTGRGENKKG